MAAGEGGEAARRPLAAVVATTAFGRMYVGAHLPLDLVGGAGLGLIVAGCVIELRPARTDAAPTDEGCRSGA